MTVYFGDFPEDFTGIQIPFNTFDSNDPSGSVTVTNLIASDIYVHKDGSATPITTDGASIDVDVNAIAGSHMITIDTSVDAAYSTGSEYAVRIEGATVDAGTVNAWVGAFSIERSGGVLELLKGVNGVAAIKAETALIVADTGELQSDDVPGLIASLDAVVDTVKVDTAAILLDTDIIDDGTSGLVKIAADVANILVDTGTTLDTKIDDIQGAGFATGTHSLEAIRVRGDAAWTGSAITSDSGTAQAGSASTMTLQAGASAVDSTYVGQVIYISAGTGLGQSRAIASYTGSSKVADVISDWAVAPSSDSVYEIYPDDITELTAAPTAAVIADAVWDENTAGHTTGGTFGEQVKNDIDAILTDTGTTIPGEIATVDANVDAILIDTDTTIPGLIATVDANVDAILIDTDTTIPGLIATVDANVDAVLLDTAEIGAAGAGLTAIITPLATVDLNVDAVLVDTDTTIPGLLGTIDTVVDAIKAKTDDLTFTKALELDVNAQSINGATVVGDGNSTPWDGA